MKKILFALLVLCTVSSPSAFAKLQNAGAPVFLLASDIDLPKRPALPTPPAVSSLRKEQPSAGKEPEPKPPASVKKQENQPSRALPERKEIKQTQESHPAADEKPKDAPPVKAVEKATPQEILEEAFPQETTDEKKTASQQTKENEKMPPWLYQLIYTVAIAALIGITVYLYTTTPKPSPSAYSRAKTAKPKSSALKPAISNQQPHFETVLPPAFTDAAKIKNTSLLEQLIKYDMETYGELRSNLDYEQPAYVEKLIRKYGNRDQEKINRAIHAYYQNRNRDKS